LVTLVRTHDGPRKTSSSTTVPVYTETLFWILTLSPRTTPPAMNTFCPRLQRAPRRAFALT
jgi:hypothetical protein